MVELIDCRKIVENLILFILSTDLDYRNGSPHRKLLKYESLSELIEANAEQLKELMEDETFAMFKSYYADTYPSLNHTVDFTSVEYDEDDMCGQYYICELFPSLSALHGDSMDLVEKQFAKELFKYQ